MAPTDATCAIDSTKMTPGTIGLPGKWPAWYHSLPVKVCSPTARTPGSSSVTRSINRNGSRCGMSASIAALSSVDIASESRDKEGDHPAVVPLRSASSRGYGVSFVMRVDQLPRAERGPAAPGDAAHVPSLLSPVVAPKNRPPHV